MSPVCSHCGAVADAAGDSFCGECGAALPAGASRTLVIGRDDGCDIRIPYGQVQVSRRHARVVLAGGLTIEDLGSGNGTTVNGRPATGPTPFGLHDEVKFGTYVFTTSELVPFLDPGLASPEAWRAPAAPRPVAPVAPQPVSQQAVAPLPVAAPAPAPVAVPEAPPASQPQVVVHVHSSAGATPYGAPAPGTVRSPVLVIVLSLLTFGIYAFIWQWMVLDEMRPWRGNQGWSGPMLLLVFVPIVGLVVIAAWFLIPSYVGDMHRRHGSMSSVSGAYGLLLFIPIVGAILYLALVQTALNDFWNAQTMARL